MNRRRADAAAGLLLGAVLLGGGALAWQADQRRRAVDGSMGSMMDGAMESMYGPDPLWLVAGTLLVVAVLGAAYLLLRPGFTTEATTGQPNTTDAPPASGRTDHAPAQAQAGTGTEFESDSDEASPATPDPGAEEASGASVPAEANPAERVLDLLPEDERRVLEPVLDSPGITQIELRDRAEFSKSKVSQTVSDLEARGLLYRERQGRTYRIYPSDELDADSE